MTARQYRLMRRGSVHLHVAMMYARMGQWDAVGRWLRTARNEWDALRASLPAGLL